MNISVSEPTQRKTNSVVTVLLFKNCPRSCLNLVIYALKTCRRDGSSGTCIGGTRLRSRVPYWTTANLIHPAHLTLYCTADRSGQQHKTAMLKYSSRNHQLIIVILLIYKKIVLQSKSLQLFLPVVLPNFPRSHPFVPNYPLHYRRFLP